MVIISTPYKKDIFKEVAANEGLDYVKEEGMKLFFNNKSTEKDQLVAEKLKKTCKRHKELKAVYFSVKAQ